MNPKARKITKTATNKDRETTNHAELRPSYDNEIIYVTAAATVRAAIATYAYFFLFLVIAKLGVWFSTVAGIYEPTKNLCSVNPAFAHDTF